MRNDVVSPDRDIGRPAGAIRATGPWLAALASLALIGAPETAHASSSPFWPGYGYSIPYEPDLFDDEARPAIRQRPRPARPRRVETPVTKAKKPSGPLIIVVSLDRQKLKIFDGNGLFAESSVSTGMKGHATPTGVFSVIQKNKWHRSNIYSGAPMPYMQRLTWSGIALHAGALPGYPASHGCIRMPNSFSAQLWNWTRRGARVVVTSGDIAPAEFEHPFLNEKLPAAQLMASESGPVKPDDLRLRPTLGAGPTLGTGPTSAGLRTADAGRQARGETVTLASDVPAQPLISATEPASQAEPPAPASPKRYGPISVFVSREDGRLYARQDFQPLFDVPITIADSDRPLGTHIFTARRDHSDKDRLAWSVLTIPERGADAPSATEALDRITVSEDAQTQIAAALGPGASFIVADQGIARGETGQGTEFVLKTR